MGAYILLWERTTLSFIRQLNEGKLLDSDLMHSRYDKITGNRRVHTLKDHQYSVFDPTTVAVSWDSAWQYAWL